MKIGIEFYFWVIDTSSLKLEVVYTNFCIKGGFKSEDTGELLHLQRKYFKSLSWAENLNFLPKSISFYNLKSNSKSILILVLEF